MKEKDNGRTLTGKMDGVTERGRERGRKKERGRKREREREK